MPWADPEKTRQNDAKRNATEQRKAQKRAWANKWRSENLEKARAYGRAYNKTEQHRKNMREFVLRRNFGITLEDYERMCVEQGGLCAICQRPPGKRALAVDHCHVTGKVRSLLCCSCNTLLGSARESAFILFGAAAYLQGHK